MPIEAAKEVSRAIYFLSQNTSGGRVRFKTDSPYVALFCRAPKYKEMPHMPLSGSHGFSIYCNGKYAGKVTPSVAEVTAPSRFFPLILRSITPFVPLSPIRLF